MTAYFAIVDAALIFGIGASASIIGRAYRSRKLRLSLGDQTGKPGDNFPARPHLQRKTKYRRIIAALRAIERQYQNVIDSDRRYLERERDEYGRYLPARNTDDLGE